MDPKLLEPKNQNGTGIENRMPFSSFCFNKGDTLWEILTGIYIYCCMIKSTYLNKNDKCW